MCMPCEPSPCAPISEEGCLWGYLHEDDDGCMMCLMKWSFGYYILKAGMRMCYWPYRMLVLYCKTIMIVLPQLMGGAFVTVFLVGVGSLLGVCQLLEASGSGSGCSKGLMDCNSRPIGASGGIVVGLGGWGASRQCQQMLYSKWGDEWGASEHRGTRGAQS